MAKGPRTNFFGIRGYQKFSFSGLPKVKAFIGVFEGLIKFHLMLYPTKYDIPFHLAIQAD